MGEKRSAENIPYSFLNAFSNALGLYSFDNPWTVVKVLRPLRSFYQSQRYPDPSPSAGVCWNIRWIRI